MPFYCNCCGAALEPLSRRWHCSECIDYDECARCHSGQKPHGEPDDDCRWHEVAEHPVQGIEVPIAAGPIDSGDFQRMSTLSRVGCRRYFAVLARFAGKMDRGRMWKWRLEVKSTLGAVPPKSISFAPYEGRAGKDAGGRERCPTCDLVIRHPEITTLLCPGTATDHIHEAVRAWTQAGSLPDDAEVDVTLHGTWCA